MYICCTKSVWCDTNWYRRLPHTRRGVFQEVVEGFGLFPGRSRRLWYDSGTLRKVLGCLRDDAGGSGWFPGRSIWQVLERLRDGLGGFENVSRTFRKVLVSRLFYDVSGVLMRFRRLLKNICWRNSEAVGITNIFFEKCRGCWITKNGVLEELKSCWINTHIILQSSGGVGFTVWWLAWGWQPSPGCFLAVRGIQLEWLRFQPFGSGCGFRGLSFWRLSATGFIFWALGELCSRSKLRASST